MLRVLSYLAALLLAVAPLAAQQPDAPPIDPDATPEARALLKQLDTLSGHATLSGEHNFPNTVSRYSDRVLELTGSYPAVFGQDFGFSAGEDKDSTLGRPAMIAEVTRQYHRGAVIALTWHAVRPTEDEPVTFHDSVQGHLTDWEWQQLLTPGSALHTRWEQQVDRIAGYLRELQDAHVAVLFRPYHEMNGNWFWWGGRPGPHGSQELYRQLQDRYLHVHHLHNLVWVWNVNAPSVNAGPVDQYFPGADRADIDTIDIYGAFEQSYYDSMLGLAGPHKPIALAEVGTMPTLATLAQQPRWAYFMMWSGSAEGANTPEALQAIFHAPNIINRGAPGLPVPPATSLTLSPGDPAATPAARALLTHLAQQGYAPATSQAATVASAQLVLLQPAGQSRDQFQAALKEVTTQGHTPLLRWTPPAPTGNGQVALDDFEWSELLKPGTQLHQAWLAEVDGLVAQLAPLRGQNIALVLDPLPEPNAATFWWAHRPGPDGSRRLLADLHTALEKAGLHVLWAWEPAVTRPGPDTRPTPLPDYFPGPLSVDLLLLDSSAAPSLRGWGGRMLLETAGTKPVLLYTPKP